MKATTILSAYGKACEKQAWHRGYGNAMCGNYPLDASPFIIKKQRQATRFWQYLESRLNSLEDENERLKNNLLVVRKNLRKSEDDLSRIRYPDTTGQ